jgi:hypothetical protein
MVIISNLDHGSKQSLQRDGGYQYHQIDNQQNTTAEVVAEEATEGESVQIKLVMA